MTYRALARTYRSRHFGELIGQDVLVRTLSNAIEKNRIHHAYLFTGIRGTGKTSTARILAKAINYSKGPTTGPTDDCPICQAIAADQCPDVIEIDAASNTGVDDVRQIIENARYAPMQARYKVFIIDEVHMLSKNAFNALLKTLEEPPAHVVFMLATTEIRKVPVTILSRVQRFDLRRVESDVLVAHYKKIAAAENVTIDDDALQLVARAAEGSVRDGLSLLDQAIAQSGDAAITGETLRRMLGQGDGATIAALVSHILQGDAAACLDILGTAHSAGVEAASLLEDILEAVHFLTRVKIKPALATDAALVPALQQLAQTRAHEITLSNLSRLWQMLLKAQSEVAQAPRPMQALEMALIRVCYASTLPPLEELHKRGASEVQATTHAPPSPLNTTSAPTTQMRVVSTTAAVPLPTQHTTQQVAQATALPNIQSVIALCEARGEPMLAADLYANMRLVSFQQGQIELIPLAGAARDFIGRLSKKLQEWTGQRWLISIGNDANARTLSEEAHDIKQARLQAVRNDPALTPWLKTFPNLTLNDITTEKTQ